MPPITRDLLPYACAGLWILWTCSAWRDEIAALVEHVIALLA